MPNKRNISFERAIQHLQSEAFKDYPPYQMMLGFLSVTKNTAQDKKLQIFLAALKEEHIVKAIHHFSTSRYQSIGSTCFHDSFKALPSDQKGEAFWAFINLFDDYSPIYAHDHFEKLVMNMFEALPVGDKISTLRKFESSCLGRELSQKSPSKYKEYNRLLKILLDKAQIGQLQHIVSPVKASAPLKTKHSSDKRFSNALNLHFKFVAQDVLKNNISPRKTYNLDEKGHYALADIPGQSAGIIKRIKGLINEEQTAQNALISKAVFIKAESEKDDYFISAHAVISAIEKVLDYFPDEESGSTVYAEKAKLLVYLIQIDKALAGIQIPHSPHEDLKSIFNGSQDAWGEFLFQHITEKIQAILEKYGVDMSAHAYDIDKDYYDIKDWSPPIIAEHLGITATWEVYRKMGLGDHKP